MKLPYSILTAHPSHSIFLCHRRSLQFILNTEVLWLGDHIWVVPGLIPNPEVNYLEVLHGYLVSFKKTTVTTPYIYLDCFNIFHNSAFKIIQPFYSAYQLSWEVSLNKARINQHIYRNFLSYLGSLLKKICKAMKQPFNIPQFKVLPHLEFNSDAPKTIVLVLIYSIWNFLWLSVPIHNFPKRVPLYRDLRLVV
jgi:hypothetical protein